MFCATIKFHNRLIENVEVNVDVIDFCQISSPTKDSSLGRREIESDIVSIISTLHIVKSKKEDILQYKASTGEDVECLCRVL